MNPQHTTSTFRPGQAWGDIVTNWWQHLPEDTGGRAALRRASDLTTVAVQPAYQRLYRRLRAAGWPVDDWRADRLAAVAGLLAHVREADGSSLPQAMSQRGSDGGDKPRVSELRFRRLLESPDVESLFAGLRRALPLMQHRCNPLSLADDVVHWGDGVRRRWAYDYDWPAEANG